MTPEQALLFSALLTVFVNSLVIVVGWRVQNSQNATIEKLKSGLEMQLHANKLAFESEREVLKMLWSASVELRKAIPEDPWSLSGLDDQTKQRKIEKYLQFIAKREAMRDVFEKNRPFYAQGIFDIVNELFVPTTALMNFTVDKEQLDNPPFPYIEIVERDRSKMVKLSEQLCNAIRERVRDQETLTGTRNLPSSIKA